MAERVYAGRSAEQRVALRREQFLAAGLEVFAAQGWAGSSVADVCRTAGLSPRFFYELFAGREDLFAAVTARIAEQVEHVVRDAVAAPADGPHGRARAVLVALAGHFTADPRTVRVALMESLATPQFRRQRRELLESFSDLAARLMRALRDDPPDARAQAALRASAAVLTGGLVELLVARATAPGAPGTPPAAGPGPGDGDGGALSDLIDHLTAMYTAVARL
jgi:AcrR family transcriptional regulator